VFLPVVLFASTLLLQQTPPAAAAQTPARTPAPATATTPAPVAMAEETTLPTVNVEGQAPMQAQTCRTEAVTGSRFGRRVCRNNVQSEDDRINSQEMLRRMQGARMPDGG
jgi:hypothetical protein